MKYRIRYKLMWNSCFQWQVNLVGALIFCVSFYSLTHSTHSFYSLILLTHSLTHSFIRRFCLVLIWSHACHYRHMKSHTPVNSVHYIICYMLTNQIIGRGSLMFSLICALNERLSKQSWGCWFETQSRSLWRHSNVCIDCTSYDTVVPEAGI